MKAQVAVLAATVCAASPLQAQPQPIRFDRLSLEEGLSQSGVLCILQDRQGFMWFGTEDGLNRYDGYAFAVFRHDPSDPASLPSSVIRAIAQDGSGDLWIGTGRGLARWDHLSDHFVRYRAEAEAGGGLLERNPVHALWMDRRGLLWIGTADAGLFRLEAGSGRLTHLAHDASDPASLSDDGVNVISEDRAGSLWVGTNDGLNRIDPEQTRFVRYRHLPSDRHSLSENRIRAIFEDRAGTLWVGTQGGGLNALDRPRRQFTRFQHDPGDASSLPHDSVRAILEDAAGHLWVGTGAGLSLQDSRDGRFARYAHDPGDPRSLSEDTVVSLLQDLGGELWVGTLSGGINKWNPATWSFGFQTADRYGHGTNNVTALSSDSAGRLWIGTFGSGLSMVDRLRNRVTRYRNEPGHAGSLSDDRVMALLHDRQGALWVGTFDGGLNRLDPGSGSFSVYRHDPRRPESLGSNAVMSLFEDSRGTLWVGTYGGGLNRYEPTTRSFTRFRHDPGQATSLSSDVVTSFAEDPGGAFWVGTDGGGLNLFDRASGRARHFRNRPNDATSLSNDTVFSLHAASGSLFVGTRGGGLDRLELGGLREGTARFRNYGEQDGLPSGVVYGIQADAAGHLWLSTNGGLSRFDPRTGSFRNFSIRDGLQGNEFNFGAHHRTAAGELLFGGPNGFNAFLPERLVPNPHQPPVVLTAFLKFNKPALLDRPLSQLDAIALDHHDDVVTLEFAALDYAAPDRNRYAYKLEGFDRDWVEIGNIHRVTYTNLDAGDYRFRVKAANNAGIWNHDGLALRIRVAPPPWQTWWAYAGYLLVAAGGVRTWRRAEQRTREREAEYRRRLEVDVQTRTAELAERSRELEESNAKLTETALTDSLTGLRNRRFFFNHIPPDAALVLRNHARHARGLAEGNSTYLVLMMVDLDGFKPINDAYGHAAGDRVLIQVRDILHAACRTSDIPIRWGGDEFLVVGRDTTRDGITILAERIRSMIEQHSFDLGGGQVASLSCSIGFASYPFLDAEPSGLSLEQMVAVADSALYVAKKSGRNAWVGFLAAPQATTSPILRSIHTEPRRLVEEGLIEVQTSTSGGQLTWA